MSAKLTGIAHRPTNGDTMIEIDECVLVPGRGLDSENRKTGKREVTLLSRQSWDDACQELGTDLPWPTRRANLLIDGLDLATCAGQTLTIGTARVRVYGETKPCALMDKQHQGLRAALVPEWRGGVTGEVLTGGTLRVGDTVLCLDQ